MCKKRILLWGALLAITLGEAAFWWAGVQLSYWGLPHRSRYTLLQGEPVVGLERIIVNFHHFFLFWAMPPDTQTYRNLYELWLSDGSSPYRNLLHPLFFGGVPFLLIWLWRYSPKETLLWLLVFNLFREYVSEGWRLEPSFSDLWVDVIFAVLGVWIASQPWRRVDSEPAMEGSAQDVAKNAILINNSRGSPRCFAPRKACFHFLIPGLIIRLSVRYNRSKRCRNDGANLYGSSSQRR